MKAIVEHLSSVIRVGKDDYQHHGDYHFAATLRWISRELVEVVGLAKPGNSPAPVITTADWRAIVEELAAHGAKRIMITRVKNGVAVQKFFSTETRRRMKAAELAEDEVR